MKKLNLNKVPKNVALMVLLFSLGVGNAWASYSHNGKVTASVASSSTGRGLVYASTENSEGEYAKTKDASGDFGSNTYGNLYIFAKPTRGYAFEQWNQGSTWQGSPQWAEGYGATDAASVLQVQGSSSDDGTNTAQISASFTQLTPYVLTFKKPENFGEYTIEYSNLAINSAGTAFEDYEKSKTLTKDSEDWAEDSYVDDKITLTATARTDYFLGWYDGESLISDKLEYTFSPSADMTISGRWKKVYTNIPLTFKAAENGTYTVGDHEVSTSDYVTSTGSFYYFEKTLTATPAEGYAFTGWYTLDGKKKNFISFDNPFEAYFDGEITLYANFTYSGYDDAVKAKFKVAGSATEYYDLNEANTAALAASNKTIICVQDGILIPGNYTISKNVTLLIPYYEDMTSNQTRAKQVNEPLSALGAYRTLVLAEGTNIIVNGNLCVSGQIASRNQDNADGRSGFPSGACGMIDMSQGGHVELNNGAVLYAWGIIKGQDKANGNNTVGVGTINAHKGSTIWEDFQVGDFRGGTACSNLNDGASTWKFFPFQSYNVCNIEVPIIYEFGATEWCYTSLRTQNNSTEFKLVASEQTLFLLKDKKSQLRKWYDPTTDQMCYEMSGTTKLDAIRIDVIFTTINSANFNLPISSNMRIIMSNTDMTLSTPVQVQAGAALEVKDDAHVTVDTDIYLFDNNEWDKWVNNRYFRSLSGMSAHKDRGDGESKTSLGTGQMIINGTVTVSENGHIYTSASGAEVIGNGGGTIIFEGELPAGKNITMFKSTTIDNANAEAVPMTAANLCNDDGSYTKSVSGATFHNVKGRWFIDGKEGEKADHTYDFTYMAEGNTGDDVETLALYSKDKTGLEDQYKWANVAQGDPCTDNYYAADGIIYNYALNKEWTQMIPNSLPNGYSGSDNKLYMIDGCDFVPSVSINDETCLYPFNDGDKALINGDFIPLTSNGYDAAYYHDDELEARHYYICFAGCNWHEATPYVGESKTYTLVEDGGTYIWFNSEWLRVEREDPFFYTEDPQSSIKTYYEYVDGEWMIAAPYVRVVDAYGEATFYSFADAVADASAKKNTTITVLRDITEEAAAFSYASGNTSCTIDLNGHTVDMDVTGRGDLEIKMFRINTPSGTVTITDNSLTKNGELRLKAKITTSSATKRWSGIGVDNGTLVMENGKVYVENHFTHTSTGNTGIVSGIQLAPGAKFTMNNGYLEATGRYSVCGVQAIEGSGAVITINGGTIDAKTITSTTCYGILAYGTTNIYGGTIKAKTKSTTAYGLYVNSSTSYAGTMNLRGGKVEATSESTTAYGVYVSASAASGKVGTFNMYGGEVEAKTASNTSLGICVSRALTYDSKEPRSIKNHYPAIANIYGGKIKATTSSSTTAEGIRTYGTTTISGGEFEVKPYSSTAFGIRIYAGTTTVSGTAAFDVQAPNTAYGVRISEEAPTAAGVVYNGTFVMDGGLFKVKTTSSTTAYGVWVGGSSLAQSTANSSDKNKYKGNYGNAGVATINGGTIDVTAKTTTAIPIYVKDSIKQSGVADKAAVAIAPKCTINGGFFKTSSTDNKTSEVIATNDKAKPADYKIYGGYFNNTTNLATYIVSPKTVIALTDADGNCPDENYPEYKYKVAEAYLVTFMNGETQLQSTLQNAGVAAVYNGLEPQKGDDGDNSYEFDGWATEADGNVAYAKGVTLPNVSAAAIYYAHFATTAKKYIITWNANGGACATELSRVLATGTETVGSADNLGGELPAASKTGHDFAGWFTAAEGGTQITAEMVVTVSVEYFAHYTVHSHTLTWDANGGAISGTYTKGSVNYGAAITAPANANVTKTGYTFAGWNATPATTMPDNDLEYTAQWTPATGTAYTVNHYKQNLDESYPVTPTLSQALTGTTDAWVTPAAQSYPGFKTPNAQTVQISADGSQVVNYYYEHITYTIAFDATTNGGTCSQDPIGVIYGQTIGSVLSSLPSATKEGNDFVGWFTKAVGGDEVTTSMEVLYNLGSVYAQFKAKPTLNIGTESGDESEKETITISSNSTVTTTIVHANGQLEISDGRTLTTTNLILEATTTTSGEIAGNVVATNAYFDLTLNNASNRRWNAFTVPFQVNLKESTGTRLEINGEPLMLGRGYDIVYYDGAERAANGPSAACWKYVEDGDSTLYPGQAYMIASAGRTIEKVRFTKAVGAPVVFSGTLNVAKNTSGTGNDADGGWNAIGNPTTYHAIMDAGVNECQVHDGGLIGDDKYYLYDLNGKLIVGKAIYVQVNSSHEVDFLRATTESVIAVKAPKRSHGSTTGNRYDVHIAPVDCGVSDDHIFVLADEDKADKYVILSDLAKAGLSTTHAQMWVDRYGEKLCKNTTALINNKAIYPLGISIPQAGEYTISNQQSEVSGQTSDMLYLTYDGRVIWNLTYSPYTASLEKGTNNHYGLRLVRSNTPTDVEQIQTGDDSQQIQKVLIDNKVYILRGDEIYTITGQKAK